MSYYSNDSYQSDSYTSGALRRNTGMTRTDGSGTDSVVDDGAWGGVQDSSYQNTQTTDVTDTFDQGPCGSDFDQQTVQTTDTTSVQDSSYGGGFRW